MACRQCSTAVFVDNPVDNVENPAAFALWALPSLDERRIPPCISHVEKRYLSPCIKMSFSQRRDSLQPLGDHPGHLHAGGSCLGRVGAKSALLCSPCPGKRRRAPWLLLSEANPLRWALLRAAPLRGAVVAAWPRWKTAQPSRREITRATFTPEAPAWARPRVTPAPSPMAKKLGMAVSSSPERASREE